MATGDLGRAHLPALHLTSSVQGLVKAQEPHRLPAAWTTGSCRHSGRRSSRRAWPRRWAPCPWAGRCWWLQSPCSPLPASPCGLWSQIWVRREGAREYHLFSKTRGRWEERAIITGGQKPQKVRVDFWMQWFKHKAETAHSNAHKGLAVSGLAEWGLWQAGESLRTATTLL